MEIINSSLLRRFSENLYENRINPSGTPQWNSPRKYQAALFSTIIILSRSHFVKGLRRHSKIGS